MHVIEYPMFSSSNAFELIISHYNIYNFKLQECSASID